jgi:hypothetical protein
MVKKKETDVQHFLLALTRPLERLPEAGVPPALLCSPLR